MKKIVIEVIELYSSVRKFYAESLDSENPYVYNTDQIGEAKKFDLEDESDADTLVADITANGVGGTPLSACKTATWSFPVSL